MTLPFISCVMLTRGHLLPARWALDNFLAQTWANKELIIVAEQAETELSAWLQAHPDARVRYVSTQAPHMSVGARRNFGVSLAQGEYMATWDEAGRHDPQRLAASMAALQTMDAQAVFLGKLQLWRPHLMRLTCLGTQPWPNTVVVSKHVMPAFPDLDQGDDTAVCQALIAQTKAILLERPDLYTAVDAADDPAQRVHLDQLEQRHGQSFFEGLDYLDKFTALNLRVGLMDEAARLSHVGRVAQRRRVNCVVEQLPGQGIAHTTLDVDSLMPPPEAMQPLVSCLMVTRGHLMPAKFAVACFQQQTWANRELVVVVDQNASSLTQWLHALQDPRIRVHVQPLEMPLGALRNQSVALATGEFVIQWDDDDLSDPDRIAACMGVLQQCRVDAVLLQRWLQWWPARRSLIASHRRPWEGSMLARKSCILPYPELTKGEDTDVMSRMLAKSSGALLDWPELYVYTVTGNNTWDAAHFEGHWANNTWMAQGCQYDDAQQALSTRMPLLAYAEAISKPSPGRWRRVDQYAPSLTPGDGVSQSVEFLGALLAQAGFETKLYLGERQHAPDFLPRTFDGDTLSLAPQEDTLLLVHFSLGDGYLSFLNAYPGQVAMYYHNMTPQALLPPPAENAVLHQLHALGVVQLRQLQSRWRLVMAASRYSVQSLSQEYGYTDIEHLPALIDTDQWCEAIQTPHTPAADVAQALAGVPFVLQVSRVMQHKGQMDALEAFHNLRQTHGADAHLVLVGDVSEAAYVVALNERVHALGLVQRVHVLGKVDRSTLVWLYQHARAYLCMSRHEGFGIPLLEAALAQCPIVAIDNTAKHEIVRGHGQLVPQWPPHDRSLRVAAALHHTLCQPWARRQAMPIPRYRRAVLVEQLRTLLQADGHRLPAPAPQCF